MPAQRLTVDVIPIGRFDVIGIDVEAQANFVKHVGLAAEAVPVSSAGPPLKLIEMMPPLARDAPPTTPQCSGQIPITVDEENRINLFIDEQFEEIESANMRKFFDGYIVLPHTAPVFEVDGTLVFRKYSCAGLVVEAYRATDLDLIVTDDTLPLIALDVLRVAYPEVRSERVRTIVGLTGEGPWPVLLPGYVIHALKRPSEEIRRVPYRPKVGDEIFS